LLNCKGLWFEHLRPQHVYVYIKVTTAPHRTSYRSPTSVNRKLQTVGGL